MRLILPILAVAAVMSCHAAEAARVVKRNIVYDTVTETNAQGVLETRKLLLDLYLPATANAKPVPLVIFAHEGCYNSKSKSNIPSDVQAWADAGLAVASVDYRLAPAYPWPAGLVDVQQALRFLRQKAATYNIDPDRIGGHGESAGGYLVAALGTQRSPDRQGNYDALSDRIVAVSDWSGRTDFTRPQPSGTDCAAVWLGLTRRQENASAFAAASIGPRVDRDAADFLIVHGTKDTTVEPFHSIDLARRLREAGRAPQLVVNTDEAHSFRNRSLISAYSRRFLTEKLAMAEPEPPLSAIGIDSGRTMGDAPAGYLTDRYFDSGQTQYYAKCANGAVRNDDPAAVYEDVRYGAAFGYHVPVTNGIHKVRLHFAECYVSKRGKRVADLALMGLTVLPGFDILAAANGKQAVAAVPEVQVVVKKGYVDLTLSSRLSGVNAVLSAVELLRME